MSLDVNELTRMEKLEGTVHDLCRKGKRDPEHYLDVLQAINDGKRVGVVPLTSSLTLPLKEQFEGFVRYNEWLKERKHSDFVISDNEMAEVETELSRAISDNSGTLLFYCHHTVVGMLTKSGTSKVLTGGSVSMTTWLAWKYTSRRRKIQTSCHLKFDPKWLKFYHDGLLQGGFYILRRPSEEGHAIGSCFQNCSVRSVRKKLAKEHWRAMGFEGIQYVGITHPHYDELMDGKDVPFIDLPGLRISPAGDGVYDYAPTLSFEDGILKLGRRHIKASSSQFGSGFLLPKASVV